MRSIFILSCIPGFLAVFAILFLTQDLHIVKRTKKFHNIWRDLWHEIPLLPRPFLLFLFLLFIFEIGSFNKLLLLSRAQEILVDQTPYSLATVLVLLYAVFNMVRACSELIIGWLSDYVNRILLLALLGCGTFAVAAWLLMASSASVGYCMCIFASAGISAAATMTLKKACAADMLPADIRGLGYGIMQASEGCASLISSALIGFLWVRYTPFVGFLYAIILSLLAMGLLFVFALTKNYLAKMVFK
jgi:MFS family permease